jgi:hypothetical protein
MSFLKGGDRGGRSRDPACGDATPERDAGAPMRVKPWSSFRNDANAVGLVAPIGEGRHPGAGIDGKANAGKPGGLVA